MILNNAKTGLPKAIMNGSVLTAMRTGAVGGVALRYLAPEDAASVGLVGCGMRDYTSFSMPARCARSRDIYLYDPHTLRIFPALSSAYRRVWHRLEKRHPDSYLRGYP